MSDAITREDLLIALVAFRAEHGLSRDWLVDATARRVPTDDVIRQLEPWFPGARARIVRFAGINAENRRRIARLRETRIGRLILRYTWDRRLAEEMRRLEEMEARK
jgi:hypothetical protein